MCGRCHKGQRDCTYPIPLRRIHADLTNGYRAERRRSTSSGSSQGQQNGSDEESQDSPDKQMIVRGSSSGSPETDPAERFANLDYDEQMVVECLAPAPPPPDSTFSTGQFPIVGLEHRNYSRQLHKQHPTDALSSKRVRELSPVSSRVQSTLFFLNFYRQVVREYHYFLYNDHQKLSTEVLLAMAEQSSALKNSMVAFAALLYSMKEPGAARHIAFVYYAIALKDLCAQLSQFPMSIEECQIAVATALQLASIDVLFALHEADLATIRRCAKVLSTSGRRGKNNETSHKPKGNVFDCSWPIAPRVVLYLRGLCMLPCCIRSSIGSRMAKRECTSADRTCSSRISIIIRRGTSAEASR